MSNDTSAASPPAAPATPTAPRPRRHWFRQVLLLGVVFVSGGVCGAGLTALVARHKVQQAIHDPDLAFEHFLSLLNRQLRLTPEQQEEIRGILAQRHAALKAIRLRVQPRVEAELHRVADEVEAVLTPAQRRRWRRLVDRMRAFRPPPPPE